MSEQDVSADTTSKRERRRDWLSRTADRVRSKIRDRSSSLSHRTAQGPDLPIGLPSTSKLEQPKPSSSRRASYLSGVSDNPGQTPRLDFLAIHERAFQNYKILDSDGAARLEKCTDVGFRDKEWRQQLQRFVSSELERARQRGGKIKLNDGHTFVVRDSLEKIAAFVKKFVEVGDVAVSYDPQHAAIPWAGIRFILKTAISYNEIEKTVWSGTESISKYLSEIYVIEQIFQDSNSPAEGLLQQACIDFHVEVFTTLAKYIRYFQSKKLVKILKSPFEFESAYTEHLERIQKTADKVRTCCSLVSQDTQRQDSQILGLILERLSEFDELKQSIRSVNDISHGIFNIVERNERQDILDWISCVPHDDHFDKNLERALEGTGEWLFKKKDFVSWRDSSASEVLRIHGPPGSGKSTLLSITIKALQDQTVLKATPSPLWFFCLRSKAESERADPVQIMRSLTRQLSVQPGGGIGISSEVVDRFRKRDQLGELKRGDMLYLCRSLIEARGPTFILIDALDECNPKTRSDLLDFLDDLLNETTELVKLFVTSRSDYGLQSTILKYPEVRIDAESNNDDIGRYVIHELDLKIKRGAIMNGQVSSELRQYIIDRILEKHGGIFRWVSLQLQRLKSFGDECEIRSSLDRLPGSLFESYDELYAREMTEMKRETPDQYQIALKTFKWLLIANRQLKLDEFCLLVGHVQSGKPKERQLLLRYCFSLVEFDDKVDAFRFCHLSVREFFEDADFIKNNKDFAQHELHAGAADQCLEMTMEATVTASGRTHSIEFNANYWLNEWAYHASKAGESRSEDPLRSRLEQMLFDPGEYESWLELEPDMVYYGSGETSWICEKGVDFKNKLVLACCWGFDEHIVRLVDDLDREGKSETFGWNGYTLVELATIHGHENVLRVLFEQVGMKASPSANSALLLALQEGFHNLTQLLIENGAEVGDRQGTKAFAIACASAPLKQVRWLLNRGARFEDAHRPRCSALLEAVLHGRVDVAQLLLNRGADVSFAAEATCQMSRRLRRDFRSAFDYSRYKYKSPLEAAAYLGNTEMMLLLLDRGPDVQLSHSLRNTALVAAATRGHLGAMEILLARGAHLGKTGGGNGSALFSAAKNGNIEAIQLLLENGVNFDQWPHDIGMALSTVARKGDFRTMEFLLARGANVKKEFALRCAIQEGHVATMKLLIDSGADITRTHERDSEAALQVVAEAGHLEAVKLLLAKGADVNAARGYRAAALSLAAWNGHIEVMRLLVDNGAKVNMYSRSNYAPLQVAKEQFRTNPVAQLRAMDGDEYHKLLITSMIQLPHQALGVATFNKQIDAMKLLLELGADVNGPYRKGEVPLNLAIRNGHFQAIELLLESGAEVDREVPKGHVALIQAIEIESIKADHAFLAHVARFDYDVLQDQATSVQSIESENIKIIKALLAHGAKVNREDQYGWTPLMASATAQTIQLLLQHGADVNQGTKRWPSPLARMVETAADVGLLQLLLDNGADVNKADENGKTALHFAAAEDIMNLSQQAEWLLDHGANINAVWHGSAPLLYLAADTSSVFDERKGQGDRSLVEVLLARGAEVNEIFEGGDYSTALQVAVSRSRESVVKLLLEHGADVHIVGKMGNAFDISERSGYRKMTELLKSHGAKPSGMSLQVMERKEGSEIPKLGALLS